MRTRARAPVIVLANAVVQPLAVVVEPSHTLVARATVQRAVVSVRTHTRTHTAPNAMSLRGPAARAGAARRFIHMVLAEITVVGVF